MSIHKIQSGHKLDFRAPKAGESCRVTRVHDTKTEAQCAEKQLRTQLERARLRGRSMPDPKITLDQVLGNWLRESEIDTPSTWMVKVSVNISNQEEKGRIRKWQRSGLGDGIPVSQDDLNSEREKVYLKDWYNIYRSHTESGAKSGLRWKFNLPHASCVVVKPNPFQYQRTWRPMERRLPFSAQRFQNVMAIA